MTITYTMFLLLYLVFVNLFDSLLFPKYRRELVSPPSCGFRESEIPYPLLFMSSLLLYKLDQVFYSCS